MFTNERFGPVLSETDSKAVKGQTKGRQWPLLWESSTASLWAHNHPIVC